MFSIRCPHSLMPSRQSQGLSLTGWWKKGSHRFLPGTLPLSELFLTLAYHKKGQIEYIPFPDKLKGRYQAFTQADLTNLRAAGYDKPFKTVAEGVTEYMAWLNRDA